MPTVVRSQVDFWLCFIASYENHLFAVYEVFEGNFDVSVFFCVMNCVTRAPLLYIIKS